MLERSHNQLLREAGPPVIRVNPEIPLARAEHQIHANNYWPQFQFWEDFGKFSGRLGELPSVMVFPTDAHRLPSAPASAAEALPIPSDLTIAVRLLITGGAMREIQGNTETNYSEASSILRDEVLDYSFQPIVKSAVSKPDSLGDLQFNTESIYASPDRIDGARLLGTRGPESLSNGDLPDGYTELANDGRSERILLRDGAGLVVEIAGGSEEFRQRMLGEIQNIPYVDRRLLAEGRIRIVIAERMTDVDPSLSSERPRQWPRGTTWKDVDGAHLVEQNLLVVSEFTRAGRTERAAGVLRHEIGHAMDDLLGNLSRSREFRESLMRDIARLTGQQRGANRYRLHPEEAIADLYAVLRGGAPNHDDTSMIGALFPRSMELLRQRLEQLSRRPIGRVRRPS